MNVRNIYSISLLTASLMFCACSTKNEANPFLSAFNTPYGAPPFDQIRIEHYEPAVWKGIEEQNQEIKRITGNPAAPDFHNTVAALDNSGETLARVAGVLYNITSAETNDTLTELYMRLAPALSEHQDNIYLNGKLFERIAQVHKQAQKDSSLLDREQQRLLDKYYKNFIRSGAALPAAQQEQLKSINKRLSELSIRYENNVLAENNRYQLLIEDENELDGMPEWVKNAAKEEATQAGHDGKWMFTLRSASFLPAMQYANRNIRNQLYVAYTNRCNHNDSTDNKGILKEIITLRLEKARLLGFSNYADFILDENMAQNSANVNPFLQQLWEHALPKAKEEAQELQAIMDESTPGQQLEAWDWWYYTEKLREKKYSLNEDELKPYFKLENVRDGVFAVAHKLYGITLSEIHNVPAYHPDVKVFEVKDADGRFLGLFYTDYFPRAGKQGGAWMSNYREQKEGVRPLICNVASFTKPVGDTPSLLTLEEVKTVFHEFGHALHGMLSQCRYTGTSGTNVARDFVELPSQIMEHWATEPEVLKMYARHYLTGETIPDALIEKIQKQDTFNQGFMTTELLAAAILDMRLHQITDASTLDIDAFQRQTIQQLGLIPQIGPRYRLTYFTHITGGYAAGYYSYLWANVLDADAFEMFKENGLFDAQTAASFRKNILEKGDSEAPMTLYKNFRGAAPTISPLLRNLGMQ